MPSVTSNGRKELVAANVFGVKIPGIEIGYFRMCRGLSIEVDVLEYAEGGNNEFVHHLPGRLRYPNLELERGMTIEDNLLKWFWQTRTKADVKEVTIDIFNKYGQVHRSFTFDSAYPIRWSGPDLATGAADAATESLTIAHAGLKMA
jgi:phage tail-like protein